MSNPYDGSGADNTRWWPFRYGAEDRAGSLNELTGERTLHALSLPRLGRIL